MGVKVRKLKGRPGWYLDIHLDGKRTTKAVGTSKRVADLVAAELELAHAKGKVGLVETTPTFAEYAARWLEFVALRRVEATTKRYRLSLARVLPHLGKKSLERITRGDIRDALVAEYRRGAAKSSISSMHAVISGVYSLAIDDGLVSVSPAARIMATLDLKDDRKPIKPMSAGEIEAVLAAIPDNLRLFFRLLYKTGCRLGEARPLTWEDLDMVGRKIRINTTASEHGVRGGTKTAENGRLVDMSDDLCRELNEAKKGKGSGLVFPNESGVMLSITVLRKYWRRACAQAGIEHRRIHDIRHTTASLLIARGAPITYVSALLGHASTKMTLDIYGHYIPKESSGAINLLETV